MIAQDARNERNPRRNRRRERQPAENTPDLDRSPVPPSEKRPHGREPGGPETALCVHSYTPGQSHPPFHVRRGLATVRPRKVDMRSNATLMCDGLHNGPHEWPPALAPLGVDKEAIERALAGDRIHESEELVE